MNTNPTTHEGGKELQDVRYINPFDPDETAQLSTKLADLVVGEYDFSGMSHELRVRRLAAFLKIYRATLDLGDLEHTADWDWRIWIETDNGLFPESDDHTMCDVLALPYTVEPSDYTTGFERWQNLMAELYDWEADTATMIPILIDSIRKITVEVL